MKNIYLETKKVLRASNKEEKFRLFEALKDNFENLSFENNSNIEVFEKPSYYKFLNITSPTKVKARKLNTKEGQIALLHSIAHIEYNAIDLALDAIYRFRDLPKQFYIDWLEVAEDEIRHFKMIEKLLIKNSSFYGELPVHSGLFDASNKALDLISRMALIPRYFEANGLDANLSIIEKLKKIENSQEIISALEIILEEEVSHVKKGDYWYKFACNENNLKCDYFKIVKNVYPNSFKKNRKKLNIKARLEAGFDIKEIEKLKEFNKKI